MRDNYVVVHGNDDFLIIHDTNRGMSVTNDAEGVVAEVAQNCGLQGRRLFYRDSQGIYDELLHDGSGFTGFRAATEIERALMEDLAG